MVVSASNAAQASNVQKAVDDQTAAVQRAAEKVGMKAITAIDHARLAAKEGVEMPPSRVQIFSDPSINTSLLKQNIRAGLDLPFRVLAYANNADAQVMYTNSDFLKLRHGLNDGPEIKVFDETLSEIFKVADVTPTSAPTKNLTKDYGIIELKSELTVAEAVASLTATVKAQKDTVWFGEIDYTAQGSKIGVELPEAVLLLFGGPKPGSIAMAKFPAIGLDAFCQKLLVYAGKDGGSVVIFNDIAALSELHYGESAKPHQALNKRLTATFQQALK